MPCKVVRKSGTFRTTELLSCANTTWSWIELLMVLHVLLHLVRVVVAITREERLL